MKSNPHINTKCTEKHKESKLERVREPYLSRVEIIKMTINNRKRNYSSQIKKRKSQARLSLFKTKYSRDPIAEQRYAEETERYARHIRISVLAEYLKKTYPAPTKILKHGYHVLLKLRKLLTN